MTSLRSLKYWSTSKVTSYMSGTIECLGPIHQTWFEFYFENFDIQTNLHG